MESVFEPIGPLEAGKDVDGSLESWMETALSLRPGLKQLQNQVKIAQEEISKSRAAHLPSVNLLGNYEFNTEDFSEWGDNYTVGAMVSPEHLFRPAPVGQNGPGPGRFKRSRRQAGGSKAGDSRTNAPGFSPGPERPQTDSGCRGRRHPRLKKPCASYATGMKPDC